MVCRCLLDGFDVFLGHLPHLRLGQRQHLTPSLAGVLDDALVGGRVLRRQLRHDERDTLGRRLFQGQADREAHDRAQHRCPGDARRDHGRILPLRLTRRDLTSKDEIWPVLRSICASGTAGLHRPRSRGASWTPWVSRRSSSDGTQTFTYRLGRGAARTLRDATTAWRRARRDGPPRSIWWQAYHAGGMNVDQHGLKAPWPERYVGPTPSDQVAPVRA